MTTQTTRKIKRMDPITLAKIFTITYGLGGLIGSFFMAIVKAGDFGFFIGFILGFTAVYTLVGFLTGLIGAFLYNIAAKITGGISVEIE